MDTKPKRTLAAIKRDLEKAKDEQTVANGIVRDLERELALQRFVPIPGFTRILMSKEDLKSCMKGDTTYCITLVKENGSTLGWLDVERSSKVGVPASWRLRLMANGLCGNGTNLGHTMTMMEAAQMAATILSEGL